MHPTVDVTESVYVAVRESDGMVKVGVSIFPAGRMRTLAVEAKCPVHLLAILELGNVKPRALERQILEDLGDHRHAGEWLRPTAEVAAYIAPMIDEDATARTAEAIILGAR